MTPAPPSPPPQPDAGTPGALLPCPWCGSRMVVADGRLSGTHETTWTYAVVCRCCEASGPPAESQDSDLARGDAESAWQSRAPAPPGPAAPEWEPYLRHLVSTLPTGTAKTEAGHGVTEAMVTAAIGGYGRLMAKWRETVGYNLRPGESSHVAAIRAALEAALAVRGNNHG